MPYEWVIKPSKAPASSGAFSHAAGDVPLAQLHLWPYRSLPKRGFVGIIGLAFLLLIIPLFALIGSTLLWGMLPFAMGALGLLWFFLNKSYRDAEIIEDLTIWADHISLTRTGPRRQHQDWHANPYWVTLNMHKSASPVVNYLTLKGDGREVEIGAFLDEAERPALRVELDQVLRWANQNNHAPIKE